MTNHNSKDLTDDDLILQMQTGDHTALHFLISRYQLIAYKFVKDYLTVFNKDGISKEEYYSVAITALYTACKKYVVGKNNFYSYYKQITMRSFADYAKRNSYRLGARNFAGISLETNVFDDNNSLTLHDTVGEEDNNLSVVLLNEVVMNYLSNHEKVTKLDLKIINLLKKGYSLLEISKAVKIKIRSVYYHIDKIQKLVVEFMNR